MGVRDSKKIKGIWDEMNLKIEPCCEPCLLKVVVIIMSSEYTQLPSRSNHEDLPFQFSYVLQPT